MVRTAVDALLHSRRTRAWDRAAQQIVAALTAQARYKLQRQGSLRILVDTSTRGHSVTHETAWVYTGKQMWGGEIPITSGYAARIPVQSPKSDKRIHREISYLGGIAVLAEQGYLDLYTSAELSAEAYRHPLGQQRGYGFFDFNLFEDLHISSIDGYVFDPQPSIGAQIDRIESYNDPLYRKISRLLPKKNHLDAWHVRTADAYDMFCFLVIDFPLIENLAKARTLKDFPSLKTEVMLPSQLAEVIGLKPVPPFLFTYKKAKWFARHDLHSELEKRTRSRSTVNEKTTKANKEEETPIKASGDKGIKRMPAVRKVLGAMTNQQDYAVEIQYEDEEGCVHSLSMRLPDAMYLLSILKGIQLTLDIPFPDDPRDANSPVVKPSDRTT